MAIPFRLVSAFTERAFGGNPAAVVVLDASDERVEDDAWCAALGAQLAQPATAILRPQDGGFRLRWFTATSELTLCGHGSLAAAHVLYACGITPADEPLAFTTKGGRVSARREGELTWLTMSAAPVRPSAMPDGLLDALAVPAGELLAGADDYLVVVEDEQVVRAARPDPAYLETLPVTRTIVTAPSGEPGVDVVSRVFPPRIGIVEDQVTGVAHAALGPYWSQRLGRARLTARQASARGGELTVEVDGDRVHLGGRVVDVAEGVLAV